MSPLAVDGSLWSLLLPARRDVPVLIAGRPEASMRKALGTRPVSASSAEGSFGAVLRFPGGPAPDPAAIDTLVRALAPQGYLVWITRRGPWRSPERAEAPPDVLARIGTIETFLGDRNSLWRPGAHGSRPLARTGKSDLVLRTLRRLVSPLFGSLTLQPHYGVALVVPGAGRGGWIMDLIAEISLRGTVPVHLDHLVRIDCTETGVAVAQIAIPAGRRWALKVALHEQAMERMRAQEAQIASLRARGGLPEVLLHAAPRILESGIFHGLFYALEAWLPGEPGSILMYRLEARERVIDRAIDWVTSLHRATLAPGRPAAEYGGMARSVLTAISTRLGEEDARFAGAAADYLEDRLGGTALPSVQGHGDFWLGNVLIDPRTSAVTGIVDWDQADAEAPPLEDILHLLSHRKWLFSIYDPGAWIRKCLAGGLPARDNDRLSGYLRALDLDRRFLGPLLLLYWVRYLATREVFFRSTPGWYVRSFGRVRDALLSDRLDRALDRIGSRS